MIQKIREKYAMDVVGAGVVNPNYKAKTGVNERLAKGNRFGKERSAESKKRFPSLPTHSPSKDYENEIRKIKAKYQEAISYAKKTYEAEMARAKERLKEQLAENRGSFSSRHFTTAEAKEMPKGPDVPRGFKFGPKARLEKATSRARKNGEQPK